MNTNSKRALSAIALLFSLAFTSSSFAQSGTITFTGRIVAPACTGSIQDSHSNVRHADAPFAVSINACANSQALVARASVSTSGNSTQQTAYLSSDNASASYSARSIADDSDDSSAIVTVTYE